jgi:xanthine dehydrogenase accessory factor
LNIFVVIVETPKLGVSTITITSVVSLESMKNIYLQILELQPSSVPLVLATVIRTNGSTPQKPGSSALFTEKGLFSGTVGGGMVEGKIHKIAMDAILSGESGQFSFNLANDITRTEDAICGGQIDILVDANMDNHLLILEKIKQSMADRNPGVLITRVSGNGKEMCIDRYWTSQDYSSDLSRDIAAGVEPEILKMLSAGRQSEYRELELTVTGEKSASQIFLEPIFPPEQLIIAGAGHIGRALAHLGSRLDFEITVIDDRPEYANLENVPDSDHIILKNIGNAMRDLEKNNNTYVVIVTRGHKDDAEALKPCIGSGLAYTGMIGSRNKIAAMRADFLEKGIADEKQWEKIHAPVGLDIKSQTVEEIAISIAAQLVLVRNSRKEKC